MERNQLFEALEHHLRAKDDIEMILLKGHLIIEQPVNQILLFDPQHSAVRAVLSAFGGMQPAPCRRAARVLNLAEREESSMWCGCGKVHTCHYELGRSAPSTISRELRRNAGRSGYQENIADQRACQHVRRTTFCNFGLHRAPAMRVAAKLKHQS